MVKDSLKKQKQVFQPIYLFVQWLSILCDSNYFAFVLSNWQTQRTSHRNYFAE